MSPSMRHPVSHPISHPALLLLLWCLPFAEGYSQERDQYQYWLELAAADQSYADRAVEIGRTAAFLEFLGEGSIVFREGPVDALTTYREREDTLSELVVDSRASEDTLNQLLVDALTWESHYIDVSRNGDFGLTAGPYTIDRPDPAADDFYGHLISIWKKTEGRWELMADMAAPIPGVLSLEVEPSYDDTRPVLQETAHPVLAMSEDNSMQRLIEADNRFGQSINFRGGQRALLRYGLENSRVYLPGYGPAVGAEAASAVYGAFLDLQLRTTNPISLTFMGGGLSSSKEMGYTYGTMATNSDETGPGFRTSYLRLWRFNQSNEWRIAVEVLNPIEESDTEDRDS